MFQELTHRGRVAHICVSKLNIIGSDNGLSPDRRQVIIRTNTGTLLIRTVGTSFSEILSKINIFSFKKMRLKMSSVKWRHICLVLNVLTADTLVTCICDTSIVSYHSITKACSCTSISQYFFAWEHMRQNINFILLLNIRSKKRSCRIITSPRKLK